MTIQITYQPTNNLTPYINNARTHSDKQIEQIAKSLQEFGWTNPILVDDDNEVIAGHGRLAAAQQLGMESVPTIKLSHLTDEQKRAYVLADNRLALNAGWDESMLRGELEALNIKEFDLSLLGFSDAELKAYLGEEQDNHPEFGDIVDTYEIIVECDTEHAQRKLLEELTERGIKCKSLLR